MPPHALLRWACLTISIAFAAAFVDTTLGQFTHALACPHNTFVVARTHTGLSSFVTCQPCPPGTFRLGASGDRAHAGADACRDESAATPLEAVRLRMVKAGKRAETDRARRQSDDIAAGRLAWWQWRRRMQTPSMSGGDER